MSAIDIEEGMNFFNEGRYFEAHEAWEKLWRNAPESPERHFIQGMIKIAAALHHYKRKEFAGTSKLLDSGMKILTEYCAADIAIDKGTFMKEVESFYNKFKSSKDIVIGDFPKMRRTG
jgi:predicted metal-dependent hydrolase